MIYNLLAAPQQYEHAAINLLYAHVITVKAILM